MIPNKPKKPDSRISTKLKSLTYGWLTPRSIDRDEVFREGVLRGAVGIIGALVLLSLATSILIFQDEWRFISFPNLHVLALLLCLLAAVSISHNRLDVAGWLIVLLALTGASGVIMLSRQDRSVEGIFLGTPIFSMVPVVAALVLPRSRIIPISLLSVIVYSFSNSIISINDFTVEGLQAEYMLVPIVLLLFFEGLLLSQLRTEFDARLEEMRRSVVETEDAKRRAEIARQQAERDRERAENADRTKSQFLANVSHELRTPLNAIIGYDEAMLAGMVGDFTPKQYELLGVMQHSSRRLLNLINDILDLSKIEAGSLDLYLSPINVNQIIQNTVDSVRSLAEKNSLSLEVSLVSDAQKPMISDMHKIEQIITNLLSNAIKFTEVGGVTIEGRRTNDGGLTLKVRDTGVGIPAEALELIFDPFQQVDGTLKRKYQGTGLGLAITKRLAEALGGSISVESEIGIGSSFTVFLPHLDKPMTNNRSE